MCGKEPFAVRPQSDKAGALPAPSRIVLRKVISQKMSVYQRDHSDRRRERFAWRLTQSAVDEENVTAVARSAIVMVRVTGEVVACEQALLFGQARLRLVSLAQIGELARWLGFYGKLHHGHGHTFLLLRLLFTMNAVSS